MKGATVVLLLAIVGIAFAVDAQSGDEPKTRDARFLGLFGLGYGYGGYGGYYGGYSGYGGYGYPYGYGGYGGTF
ncbi:unnamed protein product [Orchesella dallaii]|uniref:Uncharacterized protein n=1 Tax=Orchesella dallaii TaxID=48710 RepID=A0ABP1RYS6_9HEXA